MKRMIIISICICGVFIVSCTSNHHVKLQKLWEAQDVFMTPESIAYDNMRNCLYVSNFNDRGGFRQKEDTLHNECISKIDLDGNTIEFRWVDHLLGPTGIAILKDTLYAVERGCLAKIDIKKRKITQRISIEDTGFLNGIVVDKNGDVYLSDSQKGSIYRVRGDECHLWFQDSLIAGANGLLIENNSLIVGNKGEYNLISISITEKKMTKRIPVDINSIDGITKYKNGYIVSWMSKIMRVDHKGISQLLLDTQSNHVPNADFEFVPKENIIVVPMLTANKVIAYKIVAK